LRDFFLAASIPAAAYRAELVITWRIIMGQLIIGEE